MWPGADLGEGRLEGRPRLGRGMNTRERAVQGRGEAGESQEEQKRPQRGNECWTRSKARVLVWCWSSWPEAAADPGEAQAVRMGAASVGPEMVRSAGHSWVGTGSTGHAWVSTGSTTAGREGGGMRSEWKTRKPPGQRWAEPGGHTRHKLRVEQRTGQAEAKTRRCLGGAQ